MATFADDTAVIAVGNSVENSTTKLKSAVKESLSGLKRVNETQQIQIGIY
jgi:hypothetical protein